MNIKELKEKILSTGYSTNKKIGMYFHTKYPELYRELIDKTKDLDETFWSNKYFRARFVFLIKYNLDINKIKCENGFYTFDRLSDDFVNRTGNYTSRGWEKTKSKIPSEIYDIYKTIFILKNNNFYKNYFGKSKNRRLINDDPILYGSIYYHTNFMNSFNKNSNKLTSRIVFLVNYDGDINKLKCQTCQLNFTSFNHTTKDFNKICKSCFKKSSHYPTKEYFKNKYGDQWEQYYNQNRELISSYKVNSMSWFIKRYGETEGKQKYEKYLEERIKVLDKLKSKKISKISQKLFWLIYENLTDNEKTNCFFKELNKEKLIKIDNSKYYFADFVMNNKIIEYDGSYWHNETDDNIRNSSYNKIGFDVLSINENEFNRNKKNSEIIDKCLKFLRDEI
jgi:very-short-patch-repair endonuclease